MLKCDMPSLLSLLVSHPPNCHIVFTAGKKYTGALGGVAPEMPKRAPESHRRAPPPKKKKKKKIA